MSSSRPSSIRFCRLMIHLSRQACYECPKRPSLVSQGHRGIHAHRSSCWDVASQQRDEREQDGNTREGFKISSADSIEQAGHQARKTKRRSDADGDSNAREFQPFADNEPKDVASRGAKRHANADLVSALRHRIRNHTVNSNGPENQSQPAKQSEQHESHPPSRHRLLNSFSIVEIAKTGWSLSIDCTA